MISKFNCFRTRVRSREPNLEELKTRELIKMAVIEPLEMALGIKNKDNHKQGPEAGLGNRTVHESDCPGDTK